MMDLNEYLAEKRAIVDSALRDFMPKPEGPSVELIEAMKYSLFADGKRLRPILCIAGAEAVGGNPDDVLPVACALEMIHTYSLIHDDLPAMDNDDFRRGKPTNHKVFGEAIAILAGDALLTEAFNIITNVNFSGNAPQRILQKVISKIAIASGCRGMVGGQAVDIRMEGKNVNSSVVEYIHTHKTGAMISVSVTSGAILGGSSDQQLDSISSYGDRIGLAFQIADDILDIEGDSKKMGKVTGSDEKRGKITYPAIYGIERSKEIVKDKVESAIRFLDEFDFSADPLRHIARYIIERKK